jgi:hypothetical protein
MDPRVYRFAGDIHGDNLFRIERQHPADPTGVSVWVTCVTDPKLKIERYVRMNELVQASEFTKYVLK